MTETGPALLPARSVLLSVLLGSHPPTLPVRTLVRTAGLFGISEGTARVALSRLSADGDVVADGGTYRLSSRHLERQHDQDVALRPATRAWRGGWDVVVILPDAESRTATATARGTGAGGGAGASGGGGAGASGGGGGRDLRRFLERARMAELRPGVWARPDNLVLPPRPAASDGPALFWTARPVPDGPSHEDLAARLWDLDGWAERAGSLVDDLTGSNEPAVRLSVAAAIVRHIRSDPVLPAALLPAGWPGERLRKAYDGYRAELGKFIADLRDG